jgi:hypothetical protein
LAFSVLLVAQTALAATGFTSQVSPSSQTAANEPSVAVDRGDGTVYVAWQTGGTHVARSDDGGRSFVQIPISDTTGDVGDVNARVGGRTPCTVTGTGCTAGSHRVYVSSISLVPPLQTRLAYSDDRGAHWTINHIAAVNPSFIDRPWLAVYPGQSAQQDKVYIVYHDFTASQIWVAASTDGGTTFGNSIDVLSFDPTAEANSFCNTVPSGIEVDPETGEVYVEWITADPRQNAVGCDLTQNQDFHHVYVAHSAGAVGTGAAAVTTWDVHSVFDGPVTSNTDELFATLAVDDSGSPATHGNVYSVFPDDLNSVSGTPVFDVWLAASTDRAGSWTHPVKVNHDLGSHYFPWIAAGSSGRIDFIWLDTPSLDPTADTDQWVVTFAQTTNATSTAPKFFQTSASSGVMHVGGICTNGIFCSASNGNRDLADSISIVIDRGGSAALAWTDQGTVLHGPTHITYGCLTAQQNALIGANPGLSCKGPSGP